MIFRPKNRIRNQFIRPRTDTVKLDLSITAGTLIWVPATTWENTDTDYFAACASQLQILSFKAPSGFSPANPRHFTQLPNIAGRWVLKLNPAQTKKNQVGLTNSHFGWAETHVTYTTFANAELIVRLNPDNAAEMPGPDELQGAMRALIGSHCVAMEAAGSLRFLPLGQSTLDCFTRSCFEKDSVIPKTIWSIGELDRQPGLMACPKTTVFDITPPMWGQSDENAHAKKSLGWLKKRLLRENRDNRRKKTPLR